MDMAFQSCEKNQVSFSKFMNFAQCFSLKSSKTGVLLKGLQNFQLLVIYTILESYG